MRSFYLMAFAIFLFFVPSRLLAQTSATPLPVPTIDESNFDQWMEFVEPSEKEMEWNQLRWHDSLAHAVAEAKQLKRPILLWVMNGHPCGEV